MISRFWFRDAPPERLAAVRILVGVFATVYFSARLGELYAVAKLPVAQYAAVRAPLPPEAALAFAIVGVGLSLAFTLGFHYRIVAPLAAIVALWVTAYRNSWGMVFHTENLLVLHMIALAIAPAADVWALGPKPPAGHHAARAGYGWPLKLLAAITAATYVLAGIAKLRIAGLAWTDGELLRNQVAVDNLRKAMLGDSIAPLATQLLRHPDGFIGFAVLTLAIELGAPILVFGDLLGRFGTRLAKLWVFGAWGFHVGVVLMMNIWFPYPLSAIPFVVVFRPERGLAWLFARVRRFRGM
jgi:hypothetical protein